MLVDRGLPSTSVISRTETLCVTTLSVRGYCEIYVIYAYGIVWILQIPAGRLTPVLSVSVVSERHENKTSLPGFVLLHRLR